jgi:hypothetical protein
MNILKFLESFTDDNKLRSTSSRRESLSLLGKTTAVAAIPTGLLGMLLVPNQAAANILANANENADDLMASLQLALMLEYLDGTFYEMGLSTNGLIPNGRDRDSFTKIASNEHGHAQTIIQAMGGTDSQYYFDAPQFDYTGGMGAGNGPFNPFNDYQQFLIMSQAFEDTGVKAMKGQAPNLMQNREILHAALQLHSAESRQAAEVRQLRGRRGWIGTNDAADVPASMQPMAQMIYSGEGTVSQGGVNTSTITASQGAPALTSNAAAQSFDEPLTREQVINIAKPFLPGGQVPW